MRAAQVNARERFVNDHLDLTSESLEGKRLSVQRTYLVNEKIESRLAPLQETSEARLQTQQHVANLLGLLSPASTTMNLLAQEAGTYINSYAHVRKEIRDQLKAFRFAILPSIQANRSFTLADLDAMPAFPQRPLARDPRYMPVAL